MNLVYLRRFWLAAVVLAAVLAVLPFAFHAERHLETATRVEGSEAEVVAQELSQGKLRIEAGKASLVATRKEVQRAWLAVGDILIRERQPELAAHVRRFSDEMAPPLTDRELIATKLVERTRGRRAREGPTH